MIEPSSNDKDPDIPGTVKMEEKDPSTKGSRKSKINEQKPKYTAIQIKGKRVVFTETQLDLHRHPSTIADLFRFHEYILSLKNNSSFDISDKFALRDCDLSLIAKLAQDSELNLNDLSKEITKYLFPSSFINNNENQDEEYNSLTSEIKKAILSVSERICYGLQKKPETFFKNQNKSMHTIPELWRWETKNLNLFSSDIGELLKTRRSTREQAKRDIEAFLAINDPKYTTETIETVQNDKPNENIELVMEIPLEIQKKEIPIETRIETEESTVDEKNKAPLIPLGKVQTSLFGFFGKSNGVASNSPRTSEKPKPKQVIIQNENFKERTRPFYVKPNTFVAETKKLDEKKQLEITLKIDNIINSPTENIDLDKLILEIKRNGSKFPFKKDELVDSQEPKNKYQHLEYLNNIPQENDSFMNTEATKSSELQDIFNRKRKIIYFCESQRPCYYGTWSKKLKGLSGRNPFKMIRDDYIDYDVDNNVVSENYSNNENDMSDESDDSDFDVDKQKAQNLNHDNNGDDMDTDGDSDTSNLSDFDMDIDENEEVDIGIKELEKNEECYIMPKKKKNEKADVVDKKQGENMSNTEKMSQSKTTVKRAPITPLVPIIIGPCFNKIDKNSESNKILSNYSMYILPSIGTSRGDVFMKGYSGTKGMFFGEESGMGLGQDQKSSERQEKPKKYIFTKRDMSRIAKVVSFSPLGLKMLIEKIKQMFPDASKLQIQTAIQDMAVKEKRNSCKKHRWYIIEKPKQKRQNIASNSKPIPTTESNLNMYKSPAPLLKFFESTKK
ncbi:hypothetical protein BB559_005686 [Furculomyces boomerangus]|uniref:Uncharacterized protein n=1 Tax=Furculomyces boomerangus TaxID=61424 RepID=A0A2T9Y7E6_9FUNG|nr:hypothetical protein BB559_005686 [Furculomyces boomerangus]